MKDNNKLIILWTSSDPEVAKKMVFMYGINSLKFGWWQEITLIIWGPSSKLVYENKELQNSIIELKQLGANLEACKDCSDMYNISDFLIELGIDVKFMGKPLTDYILSGEHILTV